MAKERKTEITPVRLPKSLYETLAMIAAGEQTTVSDIIRRAIDLYLNPTRKEGA